MKLFDVTLYVMARCPPDWKDSDTRNRCEHPDTNYRDPLLDAPVTSKSTNITYRNWHCASCHRDLDANTTVIWAAKFTCPNHVRDVFDETLAEYLTYNPSTLQWNLKTRKYTQDMKSDKSTSGTTQNRKGENNDEKVYGCYLEFIALKTELQDRKSCQEGVTVVSRCPEEWKDTEMITQCEAYTDLICSEKVNTVYRNHHCMLCNNEVFRGGCKGVKGTVGYGLSFRQLLDWKELRKGTCASSEVYDPLSRVCRKVFT
jgi:hypothetical protein